MVRGLEQLGALDSGRVEVILRFCPLPHKFMCNQHFSTPVLLHDPRSWHPPLTRRQHTWEKSQSMHKEKHGRRVKDEKDKSRVERGRESRPPSETSARRAARLKLWLAHPGKRVAIFFSRRLAKCSKIACETVKLQGAIFVFKGSTRSLSFFFVFDRKRVCSCARGLVGFSFRKARRVPHNLFTLPSFREQELKDPANFRGV